MNGVVGFTCKVVDIMDSWAKREMIQPLLDELEFSAGKKNWAYPMRFGLFSISAQDMQTIARAMQAHLPG